ncbi:hypothetical protein IX306_001092 [Porphyromonas levii]|uniref:type IX secretion component PorD family protein n=1 Tax=Porphyromonas levii TaxID=28114 RepID=UPI001BA972BC|nr:DUF4835 family protein [Porphyromonas levii]MBR8773975.1 hypothetical protein [Porphyromonas levii]
MKGRRLIFAILFCIVVVMAQGQTFFAPEVIVNAYGLPENTQKDLNHLQEQLQTMLVNYAPDISVEYTPKQPIRLTMVLFVEQAIGYQYQGSIEMAFYRPRFGRDRESLLLLLQEQEINFRFQPRQSPAFIGRDIPEEQISRMIYYFATLGAMYYYDSFSLYGGAPFLSYLQEHRSIFETSWQGELSLLGQKQSKYAPSRHLEELRSDWGDRFRELWYLYHREALDSEVTTGYGEVTKIVLQGVKQLREYNSSLSFFTLFSDAKALELSQYLQAEQTSTATEIRRLSEDLFPSISFSR